MTKGHAQGLMGNQGPPLEGLVGVETWEGKSLLFPGPLSQMATLTCWQTVHPRR